MSGFRIIITPRFKIETDLLQLHFFFHKGEFATAKRQKGRTDIYIPDRFNYTHPLLRERLHRIVSEELRYQARLYLPQRFKELAGQHGFPLVDITLKNVASRWGSCSSKPHINLNVWLMAAPSHLIDSVILHELCHLRFMSHGPRFWALLDACTGGRARELDAEMKRFECEFVAYAK